METALAARSRELESVRLFVAVDLDDNARAAIGAEQKRIAAALGEGRSAVTWVQSDRMHLTLVFLGEVEEMRVPAVVEAIRRHVEAQPFEVVLENIGMFPPRGAPRAVWLGVSDGARQLSDLRDEIAARVGRLNIELESRPFRPHLTLGRWRASRSADRRRVLTAVKPGQLARLTVDGATLYQSRLSSSGPAYTALARATLSLF
jgi:RNA 2',3'-cyclic 3'-phosphodiesterase